MGLLNGGNYSNAYGVSADGGVVVGSADDGAAGNATRAFRWTQADGMVNLGVLNGGNSSFAYGVSSDGGVVVGDARDGAAGNEYRAFRWTEAGGMVSLGALNGDTESFAKGVSGDGSVVVGSSRNAGFDRRAFRWTEATGMQTVEDWLRASGVTVPADITNLATATNSDGSVVVGSLENSHAFIARGASGLVTLADVSESLGSAASDGRTALTAGELAISGAHGRPSAAGLSRARRPSGWPATGGKTTTVPATEISLWPSLAAAITSGQCNSTSS